MSTSTTRNGACAPRSYQMFLTKRPEDLVLTVQEQEVHLGVITGTAERRGERGAGQFAGGKYANADHYQMLAYCAVLNAPKAWLVYAGAGQRRSRRIVNTGVTVQEFPLDLSLHPYEVLERVRELALLATA